MLSRIIAHIIRTVLRVVGGLLFVGVILFFAITRTQVGRDQLARQIEASFDARFSGSLRIEHMTGNLARTLYASGLSVRDAEGREVVWIDSLVASPRWTGLLRKEFSVRDLMASGIQVTLYDDDRTGVSSLENTFLVADTSAHVAPGDGAWSMRDAMLAVENLQVDAESGGGGWIGWIGAHPLSSAHAKLLVSWRDDRRQLDVVSFGTVFARQGLEVSDGRSQLLFTDDEIRLTEFTADIGESTIGLVGSLNRLVPSGEDVDRGFMLEVQPSAVDLDELQAFLPQLPVQGRVTIAAMLQGPVSDMTVSWLRLERPGMKAELSGRVQGLPSSAQFEFSLDGAPMRLADVRAFLRDPAILSPLLMPELSVATYFRGTVKNVRSALDGSLSDVQVAGTVDAFSGAQSMSFSFDVDTLDPDSSSHLFQARAQHVDLGMWIGNRTLSTDITGTLSLSGTGTRLESATSDIAWDLVQPQVNSRSADRIHGSATWTQGDVRGDIAIEQGNGTIRSLISGPVLRPDGTVAIDTRLTLADITPLLGMDGMASNLNMHVTGTVSNRWNDRFAAELEITADSSWFQVGEHTGVLPPGDMRAVLHPPSDRAPEVLFSSPSLDLELESTAAIPDLVDVTRAWWAGIQQAWHDETDKWLYRSLVDDPDGSLELSNDVALAVASAGNIQSDIEARIEIRDAGWLNFLWPQPFPSVLSASATWSASLDAHRLSGSGVVRELTFYRDGTGVSDGAADMTFSADRNGSLSRRLISELELRADSLRLGGITVHQPQSYIQTRDGRADARTLTAGIGRTDSLELSTSFSLLDGWNELVVSVARLQVGPSEWRLESPAVMDLFSDATRLSSIELRHHRSDGTSTQAIRAGGILSASARDSLQVSVRDIVITDLSEFLGVRKRIGGMLNGDLTLKGGYRQPQVSGQVRMERASIERHIIGDLTLESRFVTGSPDVAIDLRIEPLQVDSAEIAGRSEAGIVVDNELRFTGMVRLPGSDPQDAGRLDLDVALERVDMFFFEYIFNEALTNVTGHGEGDGHITGTFRRPVFSTTAAILDGGFTIPSTHVRYVLNGDVEIDQDAIIINDGRISDGSGGSGTLSGRLNFNNYREFTLDLRGTTDNLQIIGTEDEGRLPFYGYIWASGSFTLAGPLYDALLRSTDAVTRPDSRLFIPIEEELSETDESFIVFEDSVGFIPDFRQLATRPFLLARRPTAERQFLDALNMDLNIEAPAGSVVSLVIDPLLGDVISAVSAGNIQLVRQNGEFFTYGQLEVSSGDYLFTAGEVFQRKFFLESGGTMTWGGDPLNAELDLDASYRTRASLAGLPGAVNSQGLVPMIVQLHITGTVTSPAVELGLAIDRSNQNVLGDYQALEAQLNQPDRATEYATSVLLTNSFRLTTESITSDSGGQLAFNSVSQLVSAQLNRFLNAALPNVEFSFGLLGENTQDLDVTYGVAWRMLDERLIIRGEGVYQGAGATDNVRANDGLQGEFIVEVRLSPRISMEVFFRREGDILQGTELTNTGGLGISYQTDFTRWRHIFSSRRDS